MELCMQTYFKFEGEIYEQLKETPTSSPISGFIAEAVMQKLEKKVLTSIMPKCGDPGLHDGAYSGATRYSFRTLAINQV
ncbi:unnamed protein product [Echinostoma caproni]|uniref:Reverse transcriptase domain-containing protein n=1 Tax=Echinostoma caproni TaxID=27848 RepID=A0A183BGF7_9TREM|nr:unnamed protein product [Echinostoma caproni]